MKAKNAAAVPSKVNPMQYKWLRSRLEQARKVLHEQVMDSHMQKKYRDGFEPANIVSARTLVKKFEEEKYRETQRARKQANKLVGNEYGRLLGSVLFMEPREAYEQVEAFARKAGLDSQPAPLY